jgi:glycosyltransferase involved in cell wall biosynthesis
MSSLPSFSIVIPSFNQAAFLEDCLQSVFAQAGVRMEIILMDGGSTDGSVDILRKHADRFAYWQSGQDRGQADAVNRGWARATGDILGWLNSDDRYLPGALSAVAGAYAAHPDAAMFYGDIDEIRMGDAAAGRKSAAGFSLRSLLCGRNLGQPGVFLARRCFREVGGLDESLQYALDFEYFLRICSRYPADQFVYVPAVLAESRLWKGTKSAVHAEKFGAEYRQVLDGFFHRTDLSPEIAALRRLSLSRSVHLRQARLCLESGNWRGALAPLLRAMWTERSPYQALRMIHLALRTWRTRV